MDEKLEQGWRIRFNVSTSVKGVKTAEFTVEGVNQTDIDIMNKIAAWQKYADTHYPVVVQEK